jgi:serine phosphatase RsbU (regulator of sigma subunit)
VLLRAPSTSAGRRRALAAILGLTVVILVLQRIVGSIIAPPSAYVVPAVLGGLLLRPAPLLFTLVIDFAGLTGEALGFGKGASVRSGSFIVLAIVAAIALLLAFDRERMIVSADQGEAMLSELRARLRRQGTLPQLADGWRSDVVQRSAGDASFGGDFIASRLLDGTLEVCVVDVSGKGPDAASRALLLSGALGGLLAAVPPEDFLDAANTYLIAQEWGEGFATATHLSLSLETGNYRLANAGHLPAVQHRAGSGTWAVVEPPGTVLGLVPGADFGVVAGCLEAGDALLLYTDGVVEAPGRDLSDGIDRLVGAAERLVSRNFAGGASALLDDVAPELTDDRTILLVWRD